jgi:putative ATP-binding cassette transporter
MRLLTFILRQSWKIIILSGLAGVLSGVSSTYLIALIHSGLNRDKNLDNKIIWEFAGLCFLVLLTGIISNYLLVQLGQGAIYDIRMRLTRQIVAVPLLQLERHGRHSLMAALTSHIPVITSAYANIPVLFISMTIVIGCLVYLAWVSWIAFLTMMVFMALGVINRQVIGKRGSQYLSLARKTDMQLHKYFSALIEAIKELKLHRPRRNTFLNNLRAVAASYRRQNVIGMTIHSAAIRWSQLLIFIYIGLLIFVLPKTATVDMNVITGCILVILFISGSLGALLNSVPQLIEANAALREIEALGLSLSHQAVKDSPSIQSEPRSDFELLELRGVTHTYPDKGDDKGFKIGPIDLTFRPGEIVFLIGGNGSGKTTLAKLITGLYLPASGQIRLNGEIVSDENREQYCQCFSAVFIDFYLFEELLGLESPDLDAKAQELLIELQLDHKVRVTGNVFSTVEVSQGQRKRLALLTACLEDRSFYVFDEWAADQDPTFKGIFYMQILPELKRRGKTVLVINHDDRYYSVADRIIKLDYGQLQMSAEHLEHRAALTSSGNNRRIGEIAV